MCEADIGTALIVSQYSSVLKVNKVYERISKLRLDPAHVLTNVVRAGKCTITIRYPASISEKFDCEHGVVEASEEIDGKASVVPDR